MEEEEAPSLADQFSVAEIEAFLRTVHPQLNYDTYSAQELFVESAWSSYRPFYNTNADGEQVTFEIASVDYFSDDEIQVAVRESYGNDRVKQEYATTYTLKPDYYDSSELRISTFSSELTNQIEKEIPIGEGEIAAFLGYFRSHYMQALNEGNSNYINPYFEQNSPAHKELRDHIASVAGKGYKFEQVEFRVDSVSKNEVNRYTATAFEKFTFTDKEEGKRRCMNGQRIIVSTCCQGSN